MNWIKVSEQLPEVNKEVLTYGVDGDRRISTWTYDYKKNFYWENAGSDSCGCCESYDDAITHWMELPEPPKK